jgi:hypothetical protein
MPAKAGIQYTPAVAIRTDASVYWIIRLRG